jgi:U3 small nucleolar ribonucleoprotein protein LCP5
MVSNQRFLHEKLLQLETEGASSTTLYQNFHRRAAISMSAEGSSIASLRETSQKLTAALLPSVKAHVESDQFSKSDGLDFLDVKNELMLSYLIDLVAYARDSKKGRNVSMSLARLNEMKVVLDKMRGLDKKLRYQIDKLLAADTSASVFASRGDNNDASEDPLQFRPDRMALGDEEDDSDSSGEDGDGDDSDDGGGSGQDDDDDLEAARATLSLAKDKKHKSVGENDDDGIYRAPRTMAVPYAFDQERKQAEKEKRERRRMRATELAQTLRAQYGEAPEQEDIHGGSDLGKQRAAARRLAEREAEKTKYEEETMVRLQTSRKDKKEKKRLMREETSNLNAIADLGNLVRETKAFGRYGDGGDRGGGSSLPADDEPKRFSNGKRRRDQINTDGQTAGRRGKVGKAKNSLQAALYNTGNKGTKKKTKR